MRSETETSCFYFWSCANGYRQNEPEATEQLYQEIAPTFVEDKEMVEAQQARLSEFGEAGLVESVGSDEGATLLPLGPTPVLSASEDIPDGAAFCWASTWVASPRIPSKASIGIPESLERNRRGLISGLHHVES